MEGYQVPERFVRVAVHVSGIQVQIIIFSQRLLIRILLILGGGFFVKVNSIWILKGIVSASLVDSDLNCVLEKPAIYTKVSDYIEWIKNVA